MKLSPTRIEFDSFIGKWIFLICFALLAVGGMATLVAVATT